MKAICLLVGVIVGYIAIILYAEKRTMDLYKKLEDK